jgi:hypothetical protein
VATLRVRLEAEMRIALKHASALMSAKKTYDSQSPACGPEFEYGVTLTAQRHATILGCRYTFRAEMLPDGHGSVAVFREAQLVCAMHLAKDSFKIVDTMQFPTAPPYVREACLAAVQSFAAM